MKPDRMSLNYQSNMIKIELSYPFYSGVQSMDIKSNYRYRNLLDWEELSVKEKKEFSHTDRELDTYVRYKKQIYLLNDFTAIVNNSPFDSIKWNGYISDSFFSGVLIKLSNDSNSAILATYYS
jgi:hypothetical protein